MRFRNIVPGRSSLCILAVSLALGGAALAVDTPSDGTILRAQLRQSYPSFAYVARYRAAFPAEIQGDDRLWTAAGGPPALRSNDALVDALAPLQDQHVAVGGSGSGGTETLGVLMRSATDGSLVAWRVFDPAVTGLSAGDLVLSIDGTPSAAWLARAAARTFGGNRRSRMAEAGLALGLGSRTGHDVARLGRTVTLQVVSPGRAPRDVSLPYLPMSAERGAALSAAVNRPDLPRHFVVDGTRVASLRLGAFAPQYDPAFNQAADAAAEVKGTSEDAAMLAGFCAVTRAFIADASSATTDADVLVVDLRGNLGGFGREARLLADALSATALPASFDVFASGTPGTLLLKQQPSDPSCGEVVPKRPIVVFTDAGTRSGGEFMAAWLWSAGAVVVGERTIGAGGGRDANEKGFELPGLGTSVKLSGNFTFFDAGKALKEGRTGEQALVDLVAQDAFAPSRTRPFAIQSVGLRPDLESASTRADLLDGGLAQLTRAIRVLKVRKALPWPTRNNRAPGAATQD
jgi:hypothetical protein